MTRKTRHTYHHAFAFALGSALLAGCQQGAPVENAATGNDVGTMTMPVAGEGNEPMAPAATGGESQATAARLAAIDAAVTRWETARDLPAARRAAEEARNLVEGPNGPDYGDGDNDGKVAGANSIGLLPGKNGEEALAQASDGACVVRDVLGGSWAKPGERWAILKTAIVDWSKSNNTFPALPSHPQRIVGWASLTLNGADLATAREYGGHARMHIDVAKKAYADCAA